MVIICLNRRNRFHSRATFGATQPKRTGHVIVDEASPIQMLWVRVCVCLCLVIFSLCLAVSRLRLISGGINMVGREPSSDRSEKCTRHWFVRKLGMHIDSSGVSPFHVAAGGRAEVVSIATSLFGFGYQSSLSDANGVVSSVLGRCAVGREGRQLVFLDV